jgi:hypothetical protein
METFARLDDLIWRQPDLETFARLEDLIWRQPDMEETFATLEDLIIAQGLRPLLVWQLALFCLLPLTSFHFICPIDSDHGLLDNP